VPMKISGRKRLAYSTGKIGAVSAELFEQIKGTEKISRVASPQAPQWCSIRVAAQKVFD